MIPEWKNRLLFPWRRSRFEDDLDEEIRFHLESRIEELTASGLPEREARLRARREFGPVARAQEGSRLAWQLRWLADFATDFRLALRSFRRNPGFTATAVLSLGLGIGATSAVFSMMDAALWRPLAVSEPERLVRIGLQRKLHAADEDVPAGLAEELGRANVFEALLILTGDGLSFEHGGRAERIVGEIVSPNYFEVLGVAPFLGQNFSAETRAGQWAPEAVLSYRFWKARFGGDPAVIGRTIRLNTRPFTIVGVSPPSFFGPMRGRDSELRLPRLPEGRSIPELAILRGSGSEWVSAMARLRPGVSRAEAEAAVNARLREFDGVLPGGAAKREIQRVTVLEGAHGWIDGSLEEFRGPFYALFALVGVALAIACANLAGLLLARAAARSKEVALRCSIGAGRGRLIRQMMTESLALSTLGGAAGLAVAGPAGRLLFGFLPQGHLALALDVRTEWRVLLFTFALATVTGLIAGVAPALAATRGNLAANLKQQSGGASARLRGGLVAAQVTFSVAVLAATGALERGVTALRPLEYRSRTERVLLFTMKPQNEIYSDARKQALFREVARRVAALPGVASAALAEVGPLGSRASTSEVALPGGAALTAEFDQVTPRFFDTIGMARITGRDFSAMDGPNAPAAAIVNQSLARALFGGANPIGRTVQTRRRDARIVGVVADAHYNSLHGARKPGIWLAAAQDSLYMPTLFVRSSRGDTGAVRAEVLREFDAIDKGFPVFNVRTLEARVADAMSRERMVAEYAAALGGLALTMAAVGLYGVLAYAVTRRRREIGIRMALGSNAGAVVWMIARDSFRLWAAGAAGGVVVALAFRPLLARMVTVPPVEPGILIGAAAVMGLAAAVATIVPAARAARVDPLAALRVE